MLMSDWSSDVCSSDLQRSERKHRGRRQHAADRCACEIKHRRKCNDPLAPGNVALHPRRRAVAHHELPCLEGDEARNRLAQRSEERRVGKGCVRTCRPRWSPDPYTKKKHKNKNK